MTGNLRFELSNSVVGSFNIACRVNMGGVSKRLMRVRSHMCFQFSCGGIHGEGRFNRCCLRVKGIVPCTRM